VRALKAVTVREGIEFFLMGAAARDVMLQHAHNVDVQRLTKDVDFAVMVRDWDAFEALRGKLLASGEFQPRPGPGTHRLLFKGGLPLDIVPFGGVERPDRTISWPPDHETIYDCFGAREAFVTSVVVRLPGGIELRVASIPALALLKVTAWHDRKHTDPGRDAPDLLLYLKSYLDCGNLDRATTEHRDLFEGEDYDYEIAGARLLARDLIKILDRSSARRILEILAPEAESEGPLVLANQSGLGLEKGRKLVAAFCSELSRYATNG
jgi:predicted nucleotidyltransferase